MRRRGASPRRRRLSCSHPTNSKERKMQTTKSNPYWRRSLVAVAVSAVFLAACSSTDAPDIESLNLAISADIQAGTTFEVVVPATTDTVISVVSAPPGVTADITEVPQDMIRLEVAVDADTPRGAYNLALMAVRDGESYELGWPFEVVEPDATAPSNGGVDTTQPSEVDAFLVVDTPQPGDVFVDESFISGRSSTSFVGYRLLAGGEAIAQGSLETANGAFDVKLGGWINDCCIEMLLEVFHVNDNGLTVTIPVAYPESS